MNKITKLLLMLIMSIMSVSAFAEEALIDGIKYDLSTETLNAEVIRNSDNPYSGDITIPDKINYNGNTYNVTSIGIEAFYECYGLKSVVIPNSVTNIKWRAFAKCTGLGSVIVEDGNTVYDSRDNCNAIIVTHTNKLIAGCKNTVIPGSVKTIGFGAFAFCSGLTSITIPNGVKTIESDAFYNCAGLTAVTIPNSVTSIAEHAFSYCKALTSVVIPNSVKTIENYTFYGCKGMTSVTIPNSVTSIGHSAFQDCAGLTSVISMIEEPFEIGDNVFLSYNDNTGNDEFTKATLYVPAETKTKYKNMPVWNKFKDIVEDGALIDGIKYDLNKETLEAVVVENTYNPYSGNIIIPEKVNYKGNTYSVTSIGDRAFHECEGLTSIIIPNTVTSIGSEAFSNCTGLTWVIIPKSVTSIGDVAFSGCSGLETVIVENGNTFYDSRDNCNAIIETNINKLIAGCKNTVIPGSVTAIGNGAFFNCTDLMSVTIPNGAETIGGSAFSGCTGLTMITIPNSVTSIGGTAFSGCTGLTMVISMIEEPFKISNFVFSNYNYDTGFYEFTKATLYVPEGTKTKYESTSAWNKFENIVEHSELIDGIKYSFNKETLEAEVVDNTYFQYSGDITIPEKVNYKGNTYCVTSIGDNTFNNCEGLTSIAIPNTVTSIGEFAIYKCGGLTSVTIPNSVTKIKWQAFSRCPGLESIIVEDGNTFYDSRDNCNAIIETNTNKLLQGCKNTVIPNSVTIIGAGAFDWLPGLTSITIPNSVKEIDNFAFSCCENLTSVTIPNGVEYIGGSAFLSCTSLTSVTIPNSVKKIDSSAFHDCKSLTSVTSMIEEPFEIEDKVFTYYNKSNYEWFTEATLYVPAGTKSKYESTPAWNKFEKIVEQEVNAVESVETDVQVEETERYNVSGQRISTPQKGINIVKMSDGTTRKVMCK